MKRIKIGKRCIGPGEPVYMVAEMSANHRQNFDEAVRIIHAAKEAGADAIKLQTYTPDTMTLRSGKKDFLINGGTPWDGQTLYDLYGEAYTPWDWQPKLKKVAEEIGLDFFSTPFDASAVDFLEEMNVPVYKIASFELVDLPLIRFVAQKKKPVILSTGMANLGEIQDAVETIRGEGNDQIVLLKCTSAYPSAPEAMNLRTIADLADRFKVAVGLSDHTLGIAVSVSAVALGACVIEKHFTVSRPSGGPDAVFSLEPHEFRDLVEAVRITEKALGKIRYGPDEIENKSKIFRRSLFAVKDIEQGETITPAHVRSIRPGYGLPPKYLDEIVGKRVRQRVERGTPLSWEMIQ